MEIDPKIIHLLFRLLQVKPFVIAERKWTFTLLTIWILIIWVCLWTSFFFRILLPFPVESAWWNQARLLALIYMFRVWSYNLNVHFLESGQVSFCRPLSPLNRKLRLSLLQLVNIAHLLRQLLNNQVPLLAEYFLARARLHELFDHLDRAFVLLHSQAVISDKCIFARHFQLLHKVVLHLGCGWITRRTTRSLVIILKGS